MKMCVRCGVITKDFVNVATTDLRGRQIFVNVCRKCYEQNKKYQI